MCSSRHADPTVTAGVSLSVTVSSLVLQFLFFFHILGGRLNRIESSFPLLGRKNLLGILGNLGLIINWVIF